MRLNTRYQNTISDPTTEGTILAIHYYVLNKIEKDKNKILNKQKFHFTYRGQHSCQNTNESKKIVNAYVNALNGSMQSQYEIGEHYENGLSGVIQKNPKMAFEWFKESAVQGYGLSEAKLGKFYLNGIGTEKNYDTGVSWYKKAAEQGIASAQYSMSVYYKRRDPKKSLELLEKAANQGNYSAILAILKAWTDDSTVKGDKVEAAERIKDAASEKQYNDLDLSELGLNKLPTCLGYLSHLTTLNLSDNEFSGFPIKIDQFLELKELFLSGCNISSLPTEINQLSQLEKLGLEDNPDLAELPTSLGQISTLKEIFTDGSKIPFRLVLATLSACRSKKDELGRLTFPNYLASWLALNGLDIDSEESKNFIKNFEDKDKESAFSNTEIGTLSVWLWRLEEVADYEKCREKLAGLVYEMLESLITNKKFKELFFDQAEANNIACQDRASMALNELYTTLRITQLSNETETLIKDDLTEEAKILALQQLLTDKVIFMEKVSKTLALRRILAEKIDNWEKQNKKLEEEDVEIYLYYETLLQEKLGLLTAIEHTTYIGRCKWINTEELVKEVNNSYLDDLIRVPIFEKLIEKEESFIKLWSKLKEKFEDRMSELDPSTFENESDYKNSIESLQKEQKKEKATIMKNWVQDIKN